MKKTYKIICLFILSVLILSSCGRRYTIDEPYIVENASPSQEQSMHTMELGTTAGIQKYNISGFQGGYNILLKGEKTTSKSYYWEEKPFLKPTEYYAYTITTMKITDILIFNGNLAPELNIGDTINILEYYGVDPDGNFYMMDSSDYYCNLRYVIIKDGESMRLWPETWKDSGFEMSPLIKNDTEYFIVIRTPTILYEGDTFIINNDDNEIEIKDTLYTGIWAYEATSEAYATAKANIQNNPPEFNSEYTYNHRFYDMNVISMYEKFVLNLPEE